MRTARPINAGGDMPTVFVVATEPQGSAPTSAHRVKAMETCPQGIAVAPLHGLMYVVPWAQVEIFWPAP